MSDQYGIGYVCAMCEQRHNPFDLCPTMFPLPAEPQMFRINLMTNPEAPITMSEPCPLAPPGWQCKKPAGHQGVCDAVHKSMRPQTADERVDELMTAINTAAAAFKAYKAQPDDRNWRSFNEAMIALDEESS